VFTIRATKAGTDRASVSLAVARRGAPPLPPMSLGTCRCCLTKQGGCLRKGEGRWAWTRRNLVCGRPGSRRRSGAQVGVAVLLLGRPVRRGSTRFHQIDPWNCSAGEAPLPEPSRTELPESPGARGRGCCCSRSGPQGIFRLPHRLFSSPPNDRLLMTVLVPARVIGRRSSVIGSDG